MKFNPEIKDLLPTGKTKTTSNEQELGWEELSDEAAVAIHGGRRIISASTTPRPITAAGYNQYAGFWGG